LTIIKLIPSSDEQKTYMYMLNTMTPLQMFISYTNCNIIQYFKFKKNGIVNRRVQCERATLCRLSLNGTQLQRLKTHAYTTQRLLS